jgi:biopolymer transport protein ExbD
MILLWNSRRYVSIMKTLLMAQLNVAMNENRRAGVRHVVKHNLKIDMTPMVDLGFLLISFFVITTELSKPTVADLYMPKDGKPMPLENLNALTVLLGKSNTVFYYHGDWQEAIKTRQIFQTNFHTTQELVK